ncbi:16S rRNA (cytosine(1402)-N(4))-methyltransferase, partial [Chloroflexota bacterium]
TCVCGHRASLRLINKRVITPSPAEVHLNPSSRSAKLRTAERLITQDEYYKTAEEHRFSPQLNAEGWRRPAVLKKLRVAFSMF